jgi:subtilase family serine protease
MPSIFRTASALGACCLLVAGSVIASAQSAQALPEFTELPAPVSTSQCEAAYQTHCYSPTQLYSAYNLNPLYARGIDGRGVTIAIVVPFGSPTIRHDLSVFDAQYGLPDPQLQIVPFGNVPVYDPTDFNDIEWAAGTTFQVEYAHAIAPRAKIVIAETAVSETEGVTGMPELMNAEKALADRGIGDVFLQIFGAAEGSFPGVDQGDDSSLLNLRYAFKDAAAHHATIVQASGDTGAAETEADGSTFYPTPAVNWPASDPLVTSVGGAQFLLDDAGRTLQPPVSWHDQGGASAGGLSKVFQRPGYQAGIAGVAGAHRAIPDVSMQSAVDGSVWVYTSFDGIGGAGWNLFNGTLGGASAFAGVVALADQEAGHRLGNINPALYTLGERSRHGSGLVDITQGDNSLEGVTGYSAGPGYDLVTGWGTIDAARFVPALALLGGREDD